MRWSIECEQVRGLIARTDWIAQGFDAHMRAFNAALDTIAAQSGAPKITEATQGLGERLTNQRVGYVYRRVEGMKAGGSNAVNAYLQADHEMVLNAQRAITSSPEPRMPGQH